jgi:hypothetical protein
MGAAEEQGTLPQAVRFSWSFLGYCAFFFVSAMQQLSEAGVAVPFRPPAPKPPRARLRPTALLGTLKRNPLECWSADFFQEPIAKVRPPFTDAFLVHDPATIKHVLVDNIGNYRKDPIQRRIPQRVWPMAS